MKLQEKDILENAMGLSISDVLMAKLGEAFPKGIPLRNDMTPGEWGRLQGQQHVIEYLRSLKEEIEDYGEQQ